MNMFYERLRRLHNQSGQSQQSAVDLIKRKTGEDIHQTTFGSYVRGDREPPISAVVAIAKTFNTSIEWLCGMVEDNRPVAALLARLEDLSFPPDADRAAYLLAQMPENQRRVHVAAIELDYEERKANAELWKRLIRSVRSGDDLADVERSFFDIITPVKQTRERVAETLFEVA
jgi:hypothetical protein